jgi:hypothetical protein
MRLHKDAKVELLKGVPLFSKLDKKALEDVAHIADEIDLPAGKEMRPKATAAASSSCCSRARPRSHAAGRRSTP